MTLPPDLRALLDGWAEQAGVSRSEMLARVIEWHDRTRPAVLAAYSGPPAPRVGQSAAEPSEGPSRPSQGQGGLRLSGVVPPGLSAYALAVLADLERGGVLIEMGDKYDLLVDGGGRAVRSDTVYNLLRAGALVRPEEA